MSRDLDRLQHLADVLSTGNEFYEHAKDDIDDAELAALCESNLADRRGALEKLQAMAGGALQEGSDLETRLEQERADLQSAVKPNYPNIYMDHLDDLEDKTQQELGEAIASAESSDVQAQLKEMEAQWQRILDRVRAAREKSAHRETPKTIPTRIMR